MLHQKIGCIYYIFYLASLKLTKRIYMWPNISTTIGTIKLKKKIAVLHKYNTSCFPKSSFLETFFLTSNFMHQFLGEIFRLELYES